MVVKRKREEDDHEGKEASHHGNKMVKHERKILIAFDFGTTFSGLCWAHTGKPDVQTPIIQWPDSVSDSLDGISMDKVPTELSYDGQSFKWGFQIEDGALRHQFFKLQLDPSIDLGDMSLASKYPDPLSAPPAYDISAEKMTIDFMTAIRVHASRVLRLKVPESALTSTPIEYIITVPAVWSDLAQQKTRACAEKAGLGAGATLHIISEPEAAAIYALDSLDPHNIKIGDTFVLVDAGGGTVDLITYTIAELRPMLKLTEASPGTGGLCGSSILNRRFQSFLEDKIGNQVGYDSEVLEEAMQRFENVVKRSCKGIFGETFFVPVPGLSDDPELGIRKHKLRLSGTDLRTIFEPILDQIIKLVMNQIQASKQVVTAVLLVGGFGQNGYLRDEIVKEVRRSSPATEVMQSPNAWTAVVRGALMKGLASTCPSHAKVTISARKARKHYGLNINKFWKPEMGDLHLREWDPLDGCYRLCKMDWFIKKGDLVEEKPIRLEYVKAQKKSHGHLTSITEDVYFCRDDLDKGAPKYENDSVRELVSLTADLTRIPIHRIPVVKGKDRCEYYKVEFEIEITFYSAFTTFELIYDNVNFGVVHSEYC